MTIEQKRFVLAKEAMKALIARGYVGRTNGHPVHYSEDSEDHEDSDEGLIGRESLAVDAWAIADAMLIAEGD